MRQKLLIASIFFWAVSVSSQEYKPLLDNLNEWHVTYCYTGCYTDVYYTDGDTIVDGKTYKILDGYHFISRTFLLREEIENKKVFLKLEIPGYNEEYLLYDFALKEGDIFNMNNPISPFPEDGGPFVLDSIVKKPLEDGNKYNHYYFSPTPENTISTNNAVWIEGAGSLSLINAPGGNPDINGVGQLSCFFKNTEVFYSDLEFVDDCIPLHLGLKSNNLNDVVVSKQSDSDKFIISNARDVKRLVVFDLYGRRVEEVNNNNMITMSIDLSNYQSGLYILQAIGSGHTKKSFKIVK